MLNDPFETKSAEAEKKNASGNKVDLQKNEANSPVVEPVSEPTKAIPTLGLGIPNSKYEYTPSSKQDRKLKRDIDDLDDEAYQERLMELNANAENKHYVLFFGQPASGKTWIIGSLLHYMKNYLSGTVYLDTNKTTESEEALFYQLQDRFNKVAYAEKITSTDTTQYFEFHINFTPKDPSRPPIEIVFIDASGEHSAQGFLKMGKKESGKLPNYLTAILESDVNTKLAFVYDQSLADEKGVIPQINVLNAVFTHIQQIQNIHNKRFSKALLLSKADLILANDLAAVERNNYSGELYALDKIPSFANSFFNESPENKVIFYKMGTFSVHSDLIMKFDKECPEKLFNWLYKEATGIPPSPERTCWDKFIRWFKGSA